MTRIYSEEERQRISEKVKKKWENPTEKMLIGLKKLQEANKKANLSEETRKRRSDGCWLKGSTKETNPKWAEVCKKISKALIGKPSPKLSEAIRRKQAEGTWVCGMQGKKHSEETKIKMSVSKIGIKPSEESKEKNRLSHLGKKQSEETIRKRVAKMIGRKMTSKHKEILRKSRIGRKHTPEAIAKIKMRRSIQTMPFEDTSIELKVQDFLADMRILHLRHFYLYKLKNSYGCDFFIPKHNIIIECDGDYWHGNPKIYTELTLTERQKKQKMNDLERTNELTSQGYKVVRLWESEIKDMNLEQFKEIVKI